MRLGIRAKQIGILVIASFMPLLLGLLTVSWLGYRHQVKQQGQLYETMALYLAGSLGQIVDEQISNLHEWLQLTDVQEQLRPLRASARGPDEIRDLDRRWPQLNADSEAVREVLDNPVAERLHRFQKVNRLFSELLVTDAKGRLVAASNKTTDFWQADENWWTSAAAMGADQAWVEGIHLDASAGVLSLDIALPIHAANGNGELLGVIKGVLNASPLLASLRPSQPGLSALCDVVLPGGQVLSPLFRSDAEARPLEGGLLRNLRAGQHGWAVARGASGVREMEGYAPILPGGDAAANRRVNVNGMTPLFVVVHADAGQVMAPVYSELRCLFWVGALLVLLFIVCGFYIADRHILRPLHRIKGTARAIAADALAREQGTSTADSGPGLQEARRELESVKTGDEIETLARDVNLMAGRVLNYHQHLESELARKTAEMKADLDLAREFQQALVPTRYPDVRASPHEGALTLRFSHVYKPTQSVGGDFFHLEKLSDHEAAVFMADVSGHGARAALVTAVLHTLLRDLSPHARAPAEFLASINREFFHQMPRSGERIVATAFYLVLDMKQGTACFASAGHPSALTIQRREARVTPLLADGMTGPALGLNPESTYLEARCPLRPGEVLLLLTDGVLGALNPDGEAYGPERVAACALRNAGGETSQMVNALADDVSRHMDTVAAVDDLCLVGVEATSSS